MLFVFGCADVSTPAIAARSASLFQTGWFVESLITQTLVIHVIRTNKIPFLQSRASSLLLATTGLIATTAIVMSMSRALGSYFGFTALPALYWPLLALTLVCYVALAQGVKTVLLRRRWL
jgi:Mg2+-importing ATPase